MRKFAPSRCARARWTTALASVCLVTTIAAVAVIPTYARSDDDGLQCVRVEIEGVGAVPGLDLWIPLGRSELRSRYTTDAKSETRMTLDLASATRSMEFRHAGFPVSWAGARAEGGAIPSRFPAWQVFNSRFGRVDATLDVALVRAKWDWNVRWDRGVVPVALRCTAGGARTGGEPTAGEPTASVRVVDCERWEEYTPDASGVAYVLWTPERVRDVVVVAAGKAPARISADALRAAARATERTPVAVSFQAARDVTVRLEAPPGFVAGTRPCAAWAWDVATGVLVAASEFLPSAREVSFTGIGADPVDVVIQAEDRAGTTWAAPWREGDGPAERPATLQPSRVSYVRSTLELPSITVRAWPSGTKCAAVRPAGVRTEVVKVWPELAEVGAMVAPGAYAVELEALPGATVPSASIPCRARQGVVATVRFDGDLK